MSTGLKISLSGLDIELAQDDLCFKLEDVVSCLHPGLSERQVRYVTSSLGDLIRVYERFCHRFSSVLNDSPEDIRTDVASVLSSAAKSVAV